MNPLFRNFLNSAERYAVNEFRRSDFGKIVGELDGALRQGERAMKVFSTRRAGLIQRYAKEFGTAPGGVRAFVDLIKALIGVSGSGRGGVAPPTTSPPSGGSGGLDRDLAAAKSLLEAFGYTVTPPPGAKPKTPEEAGFTREEPTDTAAPDWFLRGRTMPKRPQYPDDHPAVTGEMTEVDSSNVHSIGFKWQPGKSFLGTLKVRFLQAGKNGGKGPGPLYYYYGVAPQLFDAFLASASKGRFVWDRLRIRGTVSGHQYHYELKGITNGYLPREAIRQGDTEYYIGRSATFRSTKTGATRTFTSKLPDRAVGRYRPDRGAPDRPDRGSPDRPDRGR